MTLWGITWIECEKPAAPEYRLNDFFDCAVDFQFDRFNAFESFVVDDFYRYRVHTGTERMVCPTRLVDQYA
jgi:hypothetical protein